MGIGLEVAVPIELVGDGGKRAGEGTADVAVGALPAGSVPPPAPRGRRAAWLATVTLTAVRRRPNDRTRRGDAE